MNICAYTQTEFYVIRYECFDKTHCGFIGETEDIGYFVSEAEAKKYLFEEILSDKAWETCMHIHVEFCDCRDEIEYCHIYKIIKLRVGLAKPEYSISVPVSL